MVMSGSSPGSSLVSGMEMSGTSSLATGVEDSRTNASKLAGLLRLGKDKDSRQSSPDNTTTSARFSDGVYSSDTSCTSSSPTSGWEISPRVREDNKDPRSPRSSLKKPSMDLASSTHTNSVSFAGAHVAGTAPPFDTPTSTPRGEPRASITIKKDNYTPLAKRAGRGKDLSKLMVQTMPVKDAAPRKQIRLLEEDEKIFDVYYWEEVLQETGDGGKVVICEPKDGGKTPKLKSKQFRYVMKMRSKQSLKECGLQREYRRLQERLLNLPTHTNVLVPHEVLEDENFYYVVMDKAKHADFFSGLLLSFEDGVMPASEIRRLMKEILSAVGHVHRQGILHRDIKPDNLVLQHDPMSPTNKKVMLIDFDHADPDWGPDSPKYQEAIFGTMRFNAPETFKGRFSVQSDLYSVGCILYLLVAGKMPYDDSLFETEVEHFTQKELIEVWGRLEEAEIDFECAPFPEQTACRDFCRSLLAFDLHKRPACAEEALKDPWFDMKE